MSNTMDQKDLFVRKIQRFRHVSYCVLAAGAVRCIFRKEKLTAVSKVGAE